MSGISYHRIVPDGLMNAVREKKPFKPNQSFKADPVPANSPQVMSSDYKYRPGHGAPDPIPAASPKACNIEAFKPLYCESEESYAGPDPVPAATYYEGE